MSSFVNANFSPRLSWQLIVTATKHGGLGVLNPTIQQKALFYCWIYPLLFSRASSSSVPYIFYIAAHPTSRLYLTNVSNLFKYCPITGHYLLPKTPSELGPTFQYIAAARFGKNIRAFLCALPPSFCS
ncbi:hypothetical protein BD408DRAFT_438642 [Parasitella parasitica]|nr:hypothetical protein BD408DRAFT_438642 [Parasitella parasitica]